MQIKISTKNQYTKWITHSQVTLNSAKLYKPYNPSGQKILVNKQDVNQVTQQQNNKGYLPQSISKNQSEFVKLPQSIQRINLSLEKKNS